MRGTPLLILCCSLASALIGFDTTTPISPSAFACLRSSGYTFFIGQVGREDGSIDNDGIKTIKDARSGGELLPSNNSLLVALPNTNRKGLIDVDASLLPCTQPGCDSPVDQIDKVVNALNASEAAIGTLWIGVQMDIWPTDENTNRQLILDLVKQCKARGVKAGIYSDSWAWENVVGAAWKDVATLPLWWASNNGAANFSNFKPFGGWSAPTIHQYSLDVKGACSIGEVNMNWKP